MYLAAGAVTRNSEEKFSRLSSSAPGKTLIEVEGIVSSSAKHFQVEIWQVTWTLSPHLADSNQLTSTKFSDLVTLTILLQRVSSKGLEFGEAAEEFACSLRGSPPLPTLGRYLYK